MMNDALLSNVNEDETLPLLERVLSFFIERTPFGSFTPKKGCNLEHRPVSILRLDLESSVHIFRIAAP